MTGMRRFVSVAIETNSINEMDERLVETSNKKVQKSHHF